jgi:hypothetical protein
MHLISLNEAHKICHQTNSQTISNQIKPLDDDDDESVLYIYYIHTKSWIQILLLVLSYANNNKVYI